MSDHHRHHHQQSKRTVRRSFSRLERDSRPPPKSLHVLSCAATVPHGRGRGGGSGGGAGETQFCLGWRPARNPFMFYHVRRPCRTGGGVGGGPVRRSLAQPLVVRGASRGIQHTRRQTWSEYQHWLCFGDRGQAQAALRAGFSTPASKHEMQSFSLLGVRG